MIFFFHFQNHTQPTNASVHSAPAGNNDSPPTILLGCLLALIVLSFASVFVFCYRKKKSGGFFWWVPGRGRSAAAISLSKCMQQYVSNPNYYTTSPDSPLLRALKDMEIPNDKVVLQEEIGEGCFGKVHKGMH